MKKLTDKMVAESAEFDWMDWDDTDMNGPSCEVAIDNLIEDWKKVISEAIDKSDDKGDSAINLKNQAAAETRRLWIEKINSTMKF